MAETYVVGVVGQTGLAPTTYGLLQTFNENSSIEELTVKGADGNVALQDVINPVTEIDAEYVWDTEKPAPVVGNILSDGAKGWRVMSTGKVESVDGHKKLSVKLKRYDGNSIPANPA